MNHIRTYICVFICLIGIGGVYGQLSGNYFIDNTAAGGQLYSNGGSYFESFNDALDAMWAEGVSSSVIFEVAGGQVFNENLQIDSTFDGTSSTNTITFRYQGANKPIIRPAGAGISPLIGVIDVRFNGDYYLTFEGLKIVALNGQVQYRRGVRIIWGADHVTILNCEVTDFASDGIAIYFGGGLGGENEGCENNVISGNEVYHENLTSTTFAGMTGIWLNGGVNTVVKNNYVHDLIPGLTNLDGIHSIGSGDTCDVDIYNNFVSVANSVTADMRIYGIFTQHVNGTTVNVYYNSIRIGGSVDAAAEHTAALRLQNEGTTEVKNNIISNFRVKNSGVGANYSTYLGTAMASYTGNNNDMHTVGSPLAYRAGAVTDLDDWRLFTGEDANSLSVDPSFASDTDLHVIPGSPLADKGTPVPGISTDFDGGARSATTPDIGADEFPPNSAPEITSTPVTSATEEIQYSYQVTATDPDNGDDQIYSLSVAPTFLGINSSSGLITGTPDNDDVGIHDVTVVVTDLLGATDEQPYQLTVINENDAPTISNITDKNTDEDVPTGSIAFTVNDIDNDPASLIVSGSSDNTTLLPPSAYSFGGSGTNRTVNITPALNQYGSATVTITVSDGDLADNDTFELMVDSQNDPPTVANPIADQEATEEILFNFIFASNTFNDVDTGDNLGYSASLSNGNPLPEWLIFTARARTFNGTPANSDVGTIAVKVTASDNLGATVSDEFNLEVLNSNDPPTVSNPLEDQQAKEDVGLNYQFPTNTFNDIDPGDNLTYSATLSNGNPLPAWLGFTGGTRTFSGIPRNGDVGTITVKVTATDEDDASISDEFELDVHNTNDAPTVANPIPDKQASEEVEFNFVFAANTFNDVDVGDNLAYSATLSDNTPLPGWLNFTPGTRTFNGMPANGDVGTIIVKVTATDDSVESVSDQFELEVINSNDPPTVANPISDQQTSEDAVFNFIFASNTFEDQDPGDVLTYTASLSDNSALPTWLAFTAGTRRFSGTPRNNDVGTITIKVTATDNSEMSVSDQFLLEVVNTNDPPVVSNPVEDQEASEDLSFNYQIPANTFDDVDVGDNLTYEATLANDGPLPEWLIFTAGTSTFNGTPSNSDVGTFTIKVTATDNSEDSVSDEFELEVQNVNDPPVISGFENQLMNEDDSLTYSISELLGYVDDPDTPDSLLIFMPYPGENVTVSLIDDSLVVFSAPENWNGQDTIAVIVSDGLLADSALIIIDVNPVNDTPFFVGLPDTVEMFFMAEEEMNLEEFADDNDFNMPGDSLRWEVSVSDDSLKFEFDPETKDLNLTAPEYADVFTVMIKVTDDSGATAEGLFNVKVMVDPTGITELANGIPTSYELNQNYPNPFNPTTHIKFGMPNAGDVVLEVYNLLGQKIVTLFDGYKAAGYHVVDFDASNLPTGIYFYRIQSDRFQSVKKMMLVK